jgi:hypothetical protein
MHFPAHSLLVKASPARKFFHVLYSRFSQLLHGILYIHTLRHKTKRTLRDFSCTLKQLVTRRVFSPPESIKDLGQVGDPRIELFPERADTLAPISSHDFPSSAELQSGGDFSYARRSLARACVNLISARRRGRPFFARSFVAAPSTACNLSNAFGLVNNALARIHTHTLAGWLWARRAGDAKTKDKSGSVRVTLYCGGGSAGSPGQLSIKTTYAELIRRRSSYKGC